MKDFLYCILIALLIYLILAQPRDLREFSVTPLGKLIFILIILAFVMNYKLLSLLTLVLFISLNHNNIETFTNNDEFTKAHCKNNMLVKDGKSVSFENINKEFPNLKFSQNKCNPCDANCKFSITTSKEQMTKQDAITPKNSKEVFVSKENVRSSKDVEPFSNVLENITHLGEY